MRFRASPPHYLSPTQRVYMPSRILYLDTETKVAYEGRQVAVHVFRLGVACRAVRASSGEWGHAWSEHTDRGAMASYVERFCSEATGGMVIASNVVFDAWVLDLYRAFQSAGWTLDFFFDRGQVHICVVKKPKRTARFCALQNWYPVSAGDLGKSLGLPQVDVNPLTCSEPELWKRCRRDVEIMVKGMEDYIALIEQEELGSFGLSLASQAFRLWRFRFLKERVLVHKNEKVLPLERAAYHGGRTECFYIGNWPDPVVCLDVNSMYSFVMMNLRVPIRLKNYVVKPARRYYMSIPETRCIVARIQVKTDEPAYAVKTKHGLTFPVGEFEACVCSPMFFYARKAGHLQGVTELAVYDGALLFREYVRFMYALRLRLKAEGKPVKAVQAKRLLNCLYGKFGQKSSEYIRWEKTDSQRFIREDYYSQADGGWVTRTRLLGVEWVEGGAAEATDSMPAVAAHITEGARAYLWDLLRVAGRENVLYCDTDSLVVPLEHRERLSAYLDDKRLGGLSVDYTSQDITIYGPKDYVIGKRVKRKGIRAGAEQITPTLFRQEYFPGIWGLLRESLPGEFPVMKVEKELRREYLKGTVTDTGQVLPFIFTPVTASGAAPAQTRLKLSGRPASAQRPAAEP